MPTNESLQMQYEDRLELINQIHTNIIPKVFLIRSGATVGTGFLAYPKWLLTNAHVLPSGDQAKQALFLDHQNNAFYPSNRQSFLRPADSNTAPDLVAMHLDLECTGSGLHNNTFSKDETFAGRYVFYIDTTTEGGFSVKFINPVVTESLPMLFLPESGEQLHHGISGSPAIEAKLLSHHHPPKWIFKVIGAVYAKCPNEDLSAHHACVIPFDKDLSHIRKILLHDGEANSLSATSIATASMFTDPASKDKATKLQEEADDEAKEAQHQWHLYEAGDTSLNITLPEGLEKLLGTECIELKYSALNVDCAYFTRNGIKQIKDQNFAKTLFEVEYDDLLTDFASFMIDFMGKEHELKVKESWATSDHFRIDVIESDNSNSKKQKNKKSKKTQPEMTNEKVWVLTLQDNTYTTSKAKPSRNRLKGNTMSEVEGKPWSSVFAIVKIPRHIVKSVPESQSLKENEIYNRVIVDKLLNGLLNKDEASLITTRMTNMTLSSSP